MCCQKQLFVMYCAECIANVKKLFISDYLQILKGEGCDGLVMDYRKMKNKVHGSNGGQVTCAQLSCDDPQVNDLLECFQILIGCSFLGRASDLYDAYLNMYNR